MPRLFTPLCAALALVAAAPVWGGEFAPGANAGALARSFALPPLGQADVLKRGQGETRLTFDVANEFVTEGDCARECIVLDGETGRVRLSHRRGLGGGWDAAAELAFMSHGGGALDGWIQDWHGWFGLPNGGRENVADGQYLYYYARDGEVLLDERAEGSGVADLTLTVGRRLGTRRAARAMLKLPTGDESAPGGGNAGGALWLEQGFEGAGWEGYVAAGGSLNERGDVLPGQQNRALAFGGFGVMTPAWRQLRLTAQLYAHSSLYDGSDMTPLSRPGMPLSLGLLWRTAGASYELGFQEDPSVNGSPDFVLYLNVVRR